MKKKRARSSSDSASSTASLSKPNLPPPSKHPLADIDRFVEDGILDDILSHDDTNTRDTVWGSMLNSQGFSFAEVSRVPASTSQIFCCHFSSDGKLLASAGLDNKATLWNVDTLKVKDSLEEHSFLINDVRFSPNSTRFATSSFDRTVRVWDTDNPSYSLLTFTGHSRSVMSLDFHPCNEDLICSSDRGCEIRYWSVNQGICKGLFKGGMRQVRFQPRMGRFLAAAKGNVVSIFDVESKTRVHSLQRHRGCVLSLCWDQNGRFLASVSEESVRVWAFGSGSDAECIHELNSSRNKFCSCVFHPIYGSLLVIGCVRSLELWNMAENKTMTIPAHCGFITGLAASPATGMVASASHDKFVKLWK